MLLKRWPLGYFPHKVEKHAVERSIWEHEDMEAAQQITACPSKWHRTPKASSQIIPSGAVLTLHMWHAAKTYERVVEGVLAGDQTQVQAFVLSDWPSVRRQGQLPEEETFCWYQREATWPQSSCHLVSQFIETKGTSVLVSHQGLLQMKGVGERRKDLVQLIT